jgi:hypothetical protein
LLLNSSDRNSTATFDGVFILFESAKGLFIYPVLGEDVKEAPRGEDVLCEQALIKYLKTRGKQTQRNVTKRIANVIETTKEDK